MLRIIKLPSVSTMASEPLWIPDPASLTTGSTIHRSDYKGHIHTTKIPGNPTNLIASSQKPKVSAYLSTLPLSPPKNFATSKKSDQKWLDDSFQSRYIMWRRGSSLRLSEDKFDPTTNYQLFFTPKQSETQRNYQPHHVPLQTPERFSSVSTYSTDFVQSSTKRVCVDEVRFPTQRPQNRDIIVWGQTFGDCGENKGVQRRVKRHQESLPPLGQVTSYKAQFPISTHQATQPVLAAGINTSTNCHLPRSQEPKPPFLGRSNYQDDYQPTASSLLTTTNSSCGFLHREMRSCSFSGLTPFRETNKNFFLRVDPAY